MKSDTRRLQDLIGNVLSMKFNVGSLQVQVKLMSTTIVNRFSLYSFPGMAKYLSIRKIHTFVASGAD